MAELRFRLGAQAPILLPFPLNPYALSFRCLAWATGRMVVPFMEVENIEGFVWEESYEFSSQRACGTSTWK